MRAARILLVMVAILVAFACLAPLRWFSAEPVSSGAPTQPPDVTPIVFIALFLFFVAALFVPRLRPRWAGRIGIGALRTRSGWRAYKVKARAPRFNFLTCYGMVIGLAGLGLQMNSGREWAQKLPPALGTKVGFIGVVIFLVGALFTRPGDSQTKTTFSDTGKTVRRRGYYKD